MKEWLDKLKKSKKLIIVEGKKDLIALSKIGIKNVISISRKPLYSFIDKISAKEVIILTDLDKTGRKLYSILKHHLQAKGIKIDSYFREYLLKNTQLAQIEGIVNYLKKQKII